jgi:hypothetical protein
LLDVQYFDKYHWSLSANNLRCLLSEIIYNNMSSDFSLHSCNVKLLNYIVTWKIEFMNDFFEFNSYNY